MFSSARSAPPSLAASAALDYAASALFFLLPYSAMTAFALLCFRRGTTACRYVACTSLIRVTCCGKRASTRCKRSHRAMKTRCALHASSWQHPRYATAAGSAALAEEALRVLSVEPFMYKLRGESCRNRAKSKP
eukprot:4609143-Pleurochrysis_carterae.AAC.1